MQQEVVVIFNHFSFPEQRHIGRLLVLRLLRTSGAHARSYAYDGTPHGREGEGGLNSRSISLAELMLQCNATISEAIVRVHRVTQRSGPTLRFEFGSSWPSQIFFCIEDPSTAYG